jgi:hypothetical protein
MPVTASSVNVAWLHGLPRADARAAVQSPPQPELPAPVTRAASAASPSACTHAVTAMVEVGA